MVAQILAGRQNRVKRVNTRRKLGCTNCRVLLFNGMHRLLQDDRSPSRKPLGLLSGPLVAAGAVLWT